MKLIKEVLIFSYIFVICFYQIIEYSFFILNGIGILFSLLIFYEILIKKSSIRVNFFLILFFVNLIWFVLSYFWSIDSNEAFSIIRILMSIFIFSFFLYNYFDGFNKIEKVLLYFLINTFLVSIFAFITFDYSQFGLRRFDSAGNPNYISILVLIALIISLYFIVEKKKYIFTLLWPVGVTFIIVGGSRKAILGLVLAIILIALLNNLEKPKKIFKTSLVCIILITFIYQLLTNVEIFEPTYQRISNLFESVRGSNVEDGSLNSRSLMISYGINYLTEKPVIGHGVGQYRILFGHETGSGRETYSHNNFIEIAVNNGLLGLILYYSMYLYIIFKFIRLRLVRDYLGKLMVILLFIIIIIGTGEVQYYSYQYYILLTIAAKLLYYYKNNNIFKTI